MVDYDSIEIIRSRRRTFGLEIKPDGRVIARVPAYAANADIKSFIEKNEKWIVKNLAKIRAQIEENPEPQLTMEEINYLADRAMEYIPKRCAYYADVLGVTYGRITIRNQQSRWGSCTRGGNLNFNCLLMLTPPEVIDSVVVHELCHRLEMNHSKRFYEHVLRVFPEYRKWDRWLKDNGNAIMRRMTGGVL